MVALLKQRHLQNVIPLLLEDVRALSAPGASRLNKRARGSMDSRIAGRGE